jgi:hypothetical protein
MEKSISLKCDPALQNSAMCEFTGHMLATDPSWAVYRREDGMIVLYDKILCAVYVLDDIHKLDSYLDEFSYEHVKRAVATMPGGGAGAQP